MLSWKKVSLSLLSIQCNFFIHNHQWSFTLLILYFFAIKWSIQYIDKGNLSFWVNLIPDCPFKNDFILGTCGLIWHHLSDGCEKGWPPHSQKNSVLTSLHFYFNKITNHFFFNSIWILKKMNRKNLMEFILNWTFY